MWNVALGVVIFGVLILQLMGGKHALSFADGRPGKPETSLTQLDRAQASPDDRYLVEMRSGVLTVLRVFDGSRKNFSVLEKWPISGGPQTPHV